MFQVELTPIDQLKGWSNNPRVRDPERFEWIQLSLRKFGFVTPIYARKSDGLLYSGHQRTGAAKALGYDQVPVCWLPDYNNVYFERALNVNFNLCTNDHNCKADFGKKVKNELSEIISLVSLLPDAEDPYPVLKHFNVSPCDYHAQVMHRKYQSGMAGLAEFFTTQAIYIPIVLDENNQIINGINRMASAIACENVSYPAVRVTKNAQYLALLLNKITMSFDLQKAFGEELRYNSLFYRLNQAAQRTYLGVGFYHWVFAKDAAKGQKDWLLQHMTLLEGEYRQRWIAEHGTSVIDFGAGRLDNTEKLQAAGIDCIPFEPYITRPKTDTIHFQASKIITKTFLQWVAKRKPLNSVFCSSVFNSVPFEEDRECMMRIFQALCMYGAKLYVTTLHESGITQRVFSESVNKTQRSDQAILLDNEPGLIITGLLSEGPKVQKYHSKNELCGLGSRYYHSVTHAMANSQTHGIKCDGIKPIDWEKLVVALEFEFNLPYPGQQRMGMGVDALEAFSAYCEKDLIAVKTAMMKKARNKAQ